MEREPNFWVGKVPVYGDVILAPMAGFSDVPHRAICRAMGSSMNYTEFVAVEELLAESRHAWSLLDRAPGDQPMTFQIFGNDPEKLLAAAQRIEARQPDLIDVNMGCSTRKVSGRGAGVAMMRDPELVARTFSLLRRHLSVPVTGKIRLGWQEQQNYLEIGRVLEDNGAALIAIHPRTKEQKYGGCADWDAIAALKQAVSVPVVGSGDVQKPADVARMKQVTGCDAVMIGRAAIGNPWLFAGCSREDIPFQEIARLIRQHLAQMLRYYGEPDGLVRFRKHLKRYLADMPAVAPLLKQMVVSCSSTHFDDLLSAAEVLMAVGIEPAGEQMARNSYFALSMSRCMAVSKLRLGSKTRL
jgi:tRNA-dihydrouridine synthase B